MHKAPSLANVMGPQEPEWKWIHPVAKVFLQKNNLEHTKTNLMSQLGEDHYSPSCMLASMQAPHEYSRTLLAAYQAIPSGWGLAVRVWRARRGRGARRGGGRACEGTRPTPPAFRRRTGGLCRGGGSASRWGTLLPLGATCRRGRR